jgi:nucleotide-binding universal stress UspA family protein
MGFIVVAVDGSASSRAALDWALAEAALRGSSVRAVHAWEIPGLGTGEAPWALIPPGSYVDVSSDAIETAAKEALDHEVDDALARAGSKVVVERTIVEGVPADSVIDASSDAELIVVGTRGHGAVATLVLGSVSHQIARHAPCPVVLVHGA